MAELKPWLITVRLAEGRTRDYRVRATSAYHARWLFLQLNPGRRVVQIRPGHVDLASGGMA